LNASKDQPGVSICQVEWDDLPSTYSQFPWSSKSEWQIWLWRFRCQHTMLLLRSEWKRLSMTLKPISS
jgi:hypothetical protein